MARFTNYKGDKNRVRDYGQHNNLQHRPSFDSYYTGNTKYYSGIDGEIYIGDQYVDEVFNIQYQIVQESKPIFGYNSYLYDEMAVGSRVVTGSFSINFTETNYLGKILQLIQKRKIISGADTAVNNINNYSREYSSSMDPTIYRSKYPLWDQQFEILIAYGEKDKRIFGGSLDNIEVIKGIQINSRSTQLDALGTPVMEHYTFTARDIVFEGEQRIIKDVQTSNNQEVSENMKDDSISINDIFYKIESGKNGQEAVIVLNYNVPIGTTVQEVRLHPNLKNKYYLMYIRERHLLGNSIDSGVVVRTKEPLSDPNYDMHEELSLHVEFDIITNNKKEQKDFELTVPFNAQ